MTWLYHNSFEERCRKPFGALETEEYVTFCLDWLPDEPQPSGELGDICLIISDDAGKETVYPMEALLNSETDDIVQNGIRRISYQVKCQMPVEAQLMWYVFQVQKGEQTYTYGRNDPLVSGEGTVSADRSALFSYQITVYKKYREIPSWFKEGIVYQIFVDRFHRVYGAGWTNQQYPKGQHANQLLHLNWQEDPIYIRDPETNAVTHWDFFGGNLEGIIQKLPYLKTLGVSCIYLNPIFEAPSNHKYDTGDYLRIDSMYGTEEIFKNLIAESKKVGIHIILDGVFSHTGDDSRYFNRYGHYETLGAFQSKESPYYSWYRFQNHPFDYESWWDIWNMPNVNELDPGYLDYIIRDSNSVLAHWMKTGIGGWRLDVADELPDEFIRLFKDNMLVHNPDSVLIGEVWEDASNKVSYGERRKYFQGEELDSTMHYPFKDIVLGFLKCELDAGSVACQLNTIKEHYPPDQFASTLNILGTHDTRRLLSEFEGDQGLLSMAVLWQMFSPGVPHIYYGDEAGMTGDKDPMNRRPYPWGRENRYILHIYRQLGALRNLYPVLKGTEWKISAIDEHTLCMERVKYEEDGSVSNRAVLFLNSHSHQSKSIHFPLEDWKAVVVSELFPSDNKYVLAGGSLDIEVPAKSGKLIILDPWAREEMEKRSAGILMPLSALPSSYGVGDLGKAAIDFLDFLAEAGQKVWQILPYTQIDEYHSPYRSGSSLAGNLLLIDPEDLVKRELLDEQILSLARETEFDDKVVDYSKTWALKKELLRLAYLSYRENPVNFEEEGAAFLDFKEQEKTWLEDHALYTALKRKDPEKIWNQWESGLARRDTETLAYYTSLLEEEMEEEAFYQYLFFSQWDKMKEKAEQLGIRIIGDFPLYVAYDSSDVWCHQELFKLNDEGGEDMVAGVPPDYFSETGQRWGNPIYDWKEHERTGYSWWVKRVEALNRRVDTIRIDHFRGLADFYEIPASEETAMNGEWKTGPGIRFFEVLENHVIGLDILAENLGHMSQEANELKERSGYPGMLVLQHLSDGYHENQPLPHLYQRSEVLYTGTHDDDTLMGYLEKRTSFAEGLDLKAFATRTIKRLFMSDSEMVMIPLQDHLQLASEARFNRPGVAEGNWTWRVTKEQLSTGLAERLRDLAIESKRYIEN